MYLFIYIYISKYPDYFALSVSDFLICFKSEPLCFKPVPLHEDAGNVLQENCPVAREGAAGELGSNASAPARQEKTGNTLTIKAELAPLSARS